MLFISENYLSTFIKKVFLKGKHTHKKHSYSWVYSYAVQENDYYIECVRRTNYSWAAIASFKCLIHTFTTDG